MSKSIGKIYKPWNVKRPIIWDGENSYINECAHIKLHI